MRIDLLRVINLRCFESAEFVPVPLLNWLIGPNGAGKTTLLEAIFLLSHGRSFRMGGSGMLVRRGSLNGDIYAELQRESSGPHRLGLERGPGGWCARINGVDLPSLLPLLQSCAVVCFEPGTSALISGSAEIRRQFLNWGVFHVEHDSVLVWRDYRRALGQRNALLRRTREAEQFEFWEAELERSAIRLEGWRRGYLDALSPHVNSLAADFMPELGEPRLRYRPGWDSSLKLSQQLSLQREKDWLRGYTRSGPHRDEWELIFERAPGHAYLSRGQAKLAALICLLAQVALFRAHVGEWPILCLDDLGSELDALHWQRVLERLRRVEAQVFITATALPQDARFPGEGVFHVEHGCVSPGRQKGSPGDGIQWSVC